MVKAVCGVVLAKAHNPKCLHAASNLCMLCHQQVVQGSLCIQVVTSSCIQFRWSFFKIRVRKLLKVTSPCTGPETFLNSYNIIRVHAPRLSKLTYYYWPEATNLGDLMRLWVRPGEQIKLSLGFSRTSSSTSDTSKDKVLCPSTNPITR